MMNVEIFHLKPCHGGGPVFNNGSNGGSRLNGHDQVNVAAVTVFDGIARQTQYVLNQPMRVRNQHWVAA